jgi:uncharacterized protein
MNIRSPLAVAVLLAAPLAMSRPAEPSRDYPAQAVPFTRVRITDAFWAPKIEANRRISIPSILSESEKRGELLEVEPTFKTVEGAAYTLMTHPDPALEARLDAILDRIIASLVPPDRDKIWTEATWDRQLYPAGHFIEAAIAHHQATGKRKALEAALVIADRLAAIYGPGRRHMVPNHEEIEIALVRLYRHTGQRKYLDLARYFLDERGQPTHPSQGENAQDHKPVADQTEAVGHCVMAMYLYSAMTDVAALTGDPATRAALDRLWSNVVSGKMYLTGGLGSIRFHERFGAPFELPNVSGWAETCAAYGNALWNHKLFLLTGEGKYADLMERILYNGFLVGVSQSGDRFFYQNVLKAFARYERFDWINVPCCPPNIVRLLATLGSYIYARSGSDLYVNLFVGSEADVDIEGGRIGLVQETCYPWTGSVRLTVNPDRSRSFGLLIRLPGWTRGEVMPGGLYRFVDKARGAVRVAVNGRSVSATPEKGYAILRRTWKRGDVVEIELPMQARRVVARDEVREDRGRIALSRGPLVYCAEGPDNGSGALNVFLPDGPALAETFRPDVLGGVTVITAAAAARKPGRTTGAADSEPRTLTAIPYFAWANRGPAEMAVWIPRRAELARTTPVPLPNGVSRVSAFGELAKRKTGYGDQNDDLAAVHDGIEPLGSADESSLYFRLHPPDGRPGWVQYDFAAPTEVSSAEVYWVDDRRFCRLPESWRILASDDGQRWLPVSARGPYKVEANGFNTVTFGPLKVRAIRLEVEPQKIAYQAGRGGPPDAMPLSADVVWRECGIIEWRVR